MFKNLIIFPLFILLSCARGLEICEIDSLDKSTKRELFLEKYGEPNSSIIINPTTSRIYEFRYPLTLLKGKVDKVIEDTWVCDGSVIYFWFQYIDGEYVYYDHLIWKTNYHY